MLSVTSEHNGSPRKRTFSRGISEDESLRSIITESDSSSRRLTRSDSRAGTLKRTSESQRCDHDLFMGLPEMLELQTSYDEVVQELRGLEVEREALLFQVDVLQDTLEGVEELLAEAQREAGQARSELEQEREAKKKLESMVQSLMQEVERLKEEAETKPTSPENFPEPTAEEPVHMENAAEVDREPHCGSRARPHDHGGVLTKAAWMAAKAPGHMLSLSLEPRPSEDGVHRRPHGADGRRDPSPDKSDSDTTSTYEDASADTPEQDRLFPGEDSADGGELQNPKTPEACVVS